MPPVSKRRKSRKANEDVIKTEPDKKPRASGKDDENDFEQDDAEAPLKVPEVYGWTSMRDILDRKHVLRKIHSRKEETNFPFLRLPPEIRNMIYRYLLVSQAENTFRPRGEPIKEPIHLGSPVLGRIWRPGGIETAILSVNRQTYIEASKILYTENTGAISVCGHSTFISYRVDAPSAKSMTTRSLRSGRKVDMVKYTGLIYPHVVPKLRNLEVSVSLPPNIDQRHYYPWFGARIEYRVHEQIEKLAKLLIARVKQPGYEDELLIHGKKWVIKFQCSGDKVGLVALKIMLHPIMNRQVMKILRDGQVSIHIEGKMPEGWKHALKMLLSNGATVGNVTEVSADPNDLINGYKLLSYFRSAGGKYLPRTLITDEEKRKGVRHCSGCGGHHKLYSDDEGEGDDDDYDSDVYPGYPYDYFGDVSDYEDWYEY